MTSKKKRSCNKQTVFSPAYSFCFFSHFSSCSLTTNTYQYFLHLSNEKCLKQHIPAAYRTRTA